MKYKLSPRFTINDKLLCFKNGGYIKRFYPGGLFYDERGLYGSSSKKDYYNFSGEMYKAAYEALRKSGYNHEISDRLGRFITMHKAMESGYGLSIFNNLSFNYGGFGGPNSNRSFKNIDDYVNTYLTEARNRYPKIFEATTLKEYSDALFTDKYGYAPFDKDGLTLDNHPERIYDKTKSQEIYYNKIKGTKTRVNKNADSWKLMYNYIYKEPVPEFKLPKLHIQLDDGVQPPLRIGMFDLRYDR